MWPNQGPLPPPPPYSMGPQNPAFPPGYPAPYSTTPGPTVYPQGPPPAYQGHPGNPGYPACQYPSGHYSAPMNPAMIPHGPPGVMPHGPPAYPMHPAGHQFHPRGVPPGPLYYSPKGFGHKPYKGYNHHHHHPDGFNSVAGILSGGMAVGMGLLGNKANKKMRKKMKKAHKHHKHGHYRCGKSSSSSSSSSDSD